LLAYLISGEATLPPAVRQNLDRWLGRKLQTPPEVRALTPQEEQLLNGLIDRLNQTALQEKDADAEALLKQRLQGNPDALYMLAQTVLVQNMALERAKAQVAQMQEQVQQLQQHPQPAHTTSFLGRLLGERDEPPQAARQQGPAPQYQQVPPQYAAPPQPYAQYGQPYQQPYVSPGRSSFLRGALQTAAGVAAGALAFEGIESLLHGFGGGYGWGGPGIDAGIGAFGGRPVEETVINNYYDEPRNAEHHVADGAGPFNDGGYDSRNNDPSDNLRGFEQNAGAGNDEGLSAADNISDFADQASFDDQSGLDDGSLDDDSGGFDDGGGGFDDGGGGF
jgi:hypothetical protein